MKVLGFRSDPSTPRFAIVAKSNDGLSLINAATESRLPFPADCSSDPQKLSWLYREFARIFYADSSISRVVIKSGEFTNSDSKAKRFAISQEAILHLYCGLNNIPIDAKLYPSLGCTSSTTKAMAIARVGQTKRYWDAKIADAVIAAWWGVTNA